MLQSLLQFTALTNHTFKITVDTVNVLSNTLKKLSVLMLCVPSKRPWLFSYYTKMVNFEFFIFFFSFSLETIGINSEKMY